jgi:hypothetical protein
MQLASIKRGCLSENSIRQIRQGLRQKQKAALSSSPVPERFVEDNVGLSRYQLLYAFFDLATILIGQRVPELSPLRIRWPLFSSGPLTHCRIIMFAILVDSSLLTVHPCSCVIEFRS